MIYTRPPELPEDFDPYAAVPDPEPEAMPEHSIAADASAITGMTLFGLSFADVHLLLQIATLTVGLTASCITVAIHLRRWWAKK